MFRIDRLAHGDLPAVTTVGTTSRAAYTIAAILSLSVPQTLPAASAHATMNVSCQVIARAVVVIESGPSWIVITPEDIARGYVDINSPIVLRTRTNSRAGYLLETSRITADFDSVGLSLDGGSFTVGDDGALLERPYVAGGDRLTLTVRLRIAAATGPGTYPLPVVFSASPL